MCVGKIPAKTGRLGGLYLPSSYGLLSLSGTILCSGKLVTSSIEMESLGAGALIIYGAGCKTSLSCALPSMPVGLK